MSYGHLEVDGQLFEAGDVAYLTKLRNLYHLDEARTLDLPRLTVHGSIYTPDHMVKFEVVFIYDDDLLDGRLDGVYGFRFFKGNLALLDGSGRPRKVTSVEGLIDMIGDGEDAFTRAIPIQRGRFA